MIRYAGEMAAVGTALCWATGSNLFAGAGRRMGSVVLNRLRLTIAFLLLATTLLVVRGSPWPVWATPGQTGLLALSGLVGFVFGDTWYFRSLVILGPSRATLLATLAPLFTMLLGWPLLHEVPGTMGVIGLAMILGGIVLVMRSREGWQAWHAEGSVAMGIFSGVLGALGQAGGYVLSREVMRQGGLDPLSGNIIRVSAATAAIWLLAGAEREVGPTLAALRDRGAAALMVGGAIMGPFLGVTLSLTALRFIDAGIASSITAFYPVIAILIASRAHGERITLRLIAGALVAVTGVVVLFLR